MANDESSLWGVIGIAWCPVICSSSSSNPWKTSINEWRTTSVAFGGVIFFLFAKMILYCYKNILFFGSLWLMKLAIIWEWSMILMKHMEVIPVLVIKTTTSWHMETQRKNGPHAANLILKLVICKWRTIGAWRVSAISYLHILMWPVWFYHFYFIIYNNIFFL